jgi:histidine ammonia-lyase
VTTELNASDDNPLASVPDQAMISNGNFHPMVLAIACDALRIAIAQVAQLSERRMAHLWDGCMQQLTAPPTMPMYGLQVRYPAARCSQSSSNSPYRRLWIRPRWTSALKIMAPLHR